MINLRKLAEAYDCNVTQFTKIAGYTRQGFYYAIETGNVHHIRMNETLERLKDTSDRKYKYDIELAEEKRKIREQGIIEIGEICDVCIPTENEK